LVVQFGPGPGASPTLTQHWVGLPAGELAHAGEAFAVAGIAAAANAIDAAPSAATIDLVAPAVSLEVILVSNLFAESHYAHVWLVFSTVC
jgi:hypothetical protein